MTGYLRSLLLRKSATANPSFCVRSCDSMLLVWNVRDKEVRTVQRTGVSEEEEEEEEEEKEEEEEEEKEEEEEEEVC